MSGAPKAVSALRPEAQGGAARSSGEQRTASGQCRGVTEAGVSSRVSQGDADGRQWDQARLRRSSGPPGGARARGIHRGSPEGTAAGSTTRGEALLCPVDHSARESQPVARLGGCGKARRGRGLVCRVGTSCVHPVFHQLILALRLHQCVLGSVCLVAGFLMLAYN